MFFLYSKKYLIVVFRVFLIMMVLVEGSFCLDSCSDALKEYRGAFVIPCVIKNGKTYALAGCESGGKDKGQYCFPGGSSGFWIFRDVNPFDTASREFCEETLTALDYKTVRATIANGSSSMIIVQSRGKTVVGYCVLFSENDVDDIVHNFAERRAATWFWQYYYREMDHFALVEWQHCMIATSKASLDGKNGTVHAQVFNSQLSRYEEKEVTLRPIAVLLCKEYQKKANGLH